MHGTSHWLGMNVHDVGSAARLEPGMVFTNEPGIYIRPDALDLQPFGFKPEEWEKFKNEIRPAFEKYKGIGVRIEDDMLVTETGTRWMTEALPRKLTEIEAFMARAKRREYYLTTGCVPQFEVRAMVFVFLYWVSPNDSNPGDLFVPPQSVLPLAAFP